MSDRILFTANRILIIVLFSIIAIAFLVMYFTGPDKSIQECVNNKKASLGNLQVIGLEFECALEAAASLYNQDPEKAIDICVKYNPAGLPSSDSFVRNECKALIIGKLASK